MSIKHIVFLGLLIIALYAQNNQTVSLVNFLRNCAKTGQNSQCDRCKDGYKLQAGKCVFGSGQNDDGDTQGDFCQGNDTCTQARSFGSQKEFQEFVGKYNPTPILKQPQRVVQNLIKTLPSRPSGGAQSISDSFQTFSSSSGAQSVSDSFQTFTSISPPVNPAADFSPTNNQVTNVDEADLLKTDGTYIYTITNQVLSIVLAYPANRARVMSTIDLRGKTPQAIFVQKDVLAVFGTEWVDDYSYDPIIDDGPFIRTAQVQSFAARRIARPYYYPYLRTAYTFIKIYDISNRNTPRLLKDYQVSGSYFEGRKLTNGFMYLVTKYSFNYRRIVPWYDFGFGRVNIPFRKIFWYPWTYVRPSGVNIISFNLGQPLSSSIAVATLCAEDASILYMSERNIYLATNTYDGGYDYTKVNKIYVYQNTIRPVADTRVRGTTNNQFSLDEAGRFLRIATTNFNGGAWSSNVFVLNYYLRLHGSLTDIAPSEKIYSCRYVGTRLYMVTFRQIDPFFVISLSDPRSPRILGELKITGFSKFLYPYDEDTIIGIGRQADTSGRQEGLKISVFDVSDATNPKQTDSFQLEEKYANSIAEWEHKAFLMSPDKNLLVIPGTMDYQGTKFNGAFAFYVSPNEITLKAAIDHHESPYSNDFYKRGVERSLYIEQFLYTKSKCLIKINRLESFQFVKNIEINCSDAVSPPIIRPFPIDPIPLPRPFPRPRFPDFEIAEAFSAAQAV